MRGYSLGREVIFDLDQKLPKMHGQGFQLEEIQPGEEWR
jgi:hypothetical protein